jgi:uncharacterized protein
MTFIVVSLHDVAPRTADQSRRWMDLLRALDLTVSVLVVPGPWKGSPRVDEDAPTAAWLRDLAVNGHEIVQHGWAHAEPRTPQPGGPVVATVGRVLARGCAEFWRLAEADAGARLRAGRRALHRAGLEAPGFIAPGWLMSSGALRAVATAGFEFTTTHRAVIDLVTEQKVFCPVLSQRSASPLTGAAVATTSATASWRVRRQLPIRLAVHPDDLDDGRTRHAVLSTCRRALDAGCESLTYGDVVRAARFVPATGG